jgi:16S rRNA (cytidine1402-2'-O)-methyltransferase
MSQDSTGRDRRYAVRGATLEAGPLAPGLYLVATPIGNLSDITLRALDTLAAADVIACEDTRVTRKLLDRFRIHAPTTAYHEHSGGQARARLLERLERGEAVALVSDAGTPLLSDPGYRLVAGAVEAGHPVIPVPGASSVLAALMGAGLPTDTVLFAGFPSHKEKARRDRLADLARVPATLVFFESPNRLAALLADAADVLGHERPAAVAREITKLHETFHRATLGALAERYRDKAVRGEVAVVVGPPLDEVAPSADDIDRRLAEALAGGGVRDAAERVAAETGVARRTLYERALALKKGEHDA